MEKEKDVKFTRWIEQMMEEEARGEDFDRTENVVEHYKPVETLS